MKKYKYSLKARLWRQIKKRKAVYVSKRQFKRMYGIEYNPDYTYENNLGIKIYVE